MSRTTGGAEVTILSPARRLAAALDPVIMVRHAGITADPWQETVLRSQARRIILLCSRQSGKSSTVASITMHTAVCQPNSLILIGAPSQNQSAELLLKAKAIYNVGGQMEVFDDVEHGLEKYNLHNAVLRMRLSNRSRIICVPGKEGTVRAYSAVKLLVVDEASYVPDTFYQAVFPMLAVSGGRVILLSTPHAKFGAFYDIWTEAPEWDFRLPAEAQEEAWLKIKVPWWECPRIRPAFIEAERARFGNAYVQREYELEFADAITAAFRTEDIDAMARDDVEPWACAGWAR
jgi:hypothetical protein